MNCLSEAFCRSNSYFAGILQTIPGSSKDKTRFNKRMKKILLTIVSLFIAYWSYSQVNLEGTWNGYLVTPEDHLTIRVKFSNTGGDVQGWLDIPDQSANGLKLSNIKQWNDTLSFEFQAGRSRLEFQGRIYEDSISGDFRQAEFNSSFKLIKSTSDQRPNNRINGKSEFVNFSNDSIILSGTLTFPNDKQGPCPAIVLVSGSGGQTRECEYFGFKMFTLLSEHLNNMGFAVLTYDDRGVGESGGILDNATTFDFAQDASKAIDYLRTREDINPDQIGVLGHSEGAIIAYYLAARDPKIYLIIALAGPALGGEQVLISQIQRIAEVGKHSDQEVLDAMQKIRDPGNPWMATFIKHNPEDDLRKISCPVLAVFGGKDLQVEPTRNASLMECYFKESGNKDFKICVFPKANHLFQKAKTGLPAEYADLDPQFVEGFLKTIQDWLEVISVEK